MTDPQKRLELLNRMWINYRTEYPEEESELYRDIVRDINRDILLEPVEFEVEVDGNWAKCPVCGSNVNDWSSCCRCYTCGQALDWTNLIEKGKA